MIDTKVELIESILDQAIQKTMKTNHIQLVSITKKIDTIDPLHFFESAKQLDGDRTFWSSTAEKFFMVGVGSTYKIEATGNRFAETDEQWRRVKQQAIVHNSFQQPGTGLVAMGGMAFDPGKDKTLLWENFSDSEFTVPSYILTKYGDDHYLTMNVNVSKEDLASDLARNYHQNVHTLLDSNGTELVRTKIVDKNEIEPDKWKQTVDDATEQIKTSTLEKIVLSRELRVKLNQQTEITAILQDLINTQTNSFVFAFERGEDCFVGATPERLLKIENEQ